MIDVNCYCGVFEAKFSRGIWTIFQLHFSSKIFIEFLPLNGYRLWKNKFLNKQQNLLIKKYIHVYHMWWLDTEADFEYITPLYATYGNMICYVVEVIYMTSNLAIRYIYLYIYIQTQTIRLDIHIT